MMTPIAPYRSNETINKPKYAPCWLQRWFRVIDSVRIPVHSRNTAHRKSPRMHSGSNRYRSGTFVSDTTHTVQCTVCLFSLSDWIHPITRMSLQHPVHYQLLYLVLYVSFSFSQRWIAAHGRFFHPIVRTRRKVLKHKSKSSSFQQSTVDLIWVLLCFRASYLHLRPP